MRMFHLLPNPIFRILPGPSGVETRPPLPRNYTMATTSSFGKFAISHNSASASASSFTISCFSSVTATSLRHELPSTQEDSSPDTQPEISQQSPYCPIFSTRPKSPHLNIGRSMSSSTSNSSKKASTKPASSATFRPYSKTLPSWKVVEENAFYLALPLFFPNVYHIKNHTFHHRV